MDGVGALSAGPSAARRVDLEVRPASFVAGSPQVPPDKSISHRAALIAAVAEGESLVENFLPALDCLATLHCLRLLGVEAEGPDGTGSVRIRGRPLASGGFAEPPDVLDVGNSGTTLRLLSGLVAAHPVLAILTGDASIRRRPMQRVIDPLTQMGASFWSRRGGLAPLALRGGSLKGLTWSPPVASAQVKSAVLLAGLQAQGATHLQEVAPTRDHTERMLRYFGARIDYGRGWARLEGPQTLEARRLRVPADPSSAAVVWAAAAALPGSRVRTPGVGLNPGRIEFLAVLQEMGARVRVEGEPQGPWDEPRGTVEVACDRPLTGVELGGARIPALIDELPLVAVLGALARGTTVVRDAQELRHKESNRIDDLAAELAALGIGVEARPDGFAVRGAQRPRGGVARSRGDHRLAMALCVAALAARAPTTVQEAGCIATSFPDFARLMDGLVREGGGQVIERERHESC